MTPQMEIAVAMFFLAVGTAGPPLELPRIALALIICAAASQSGKFIGGVAMLATIGCAWLQHGHVRLTSLFAATALGILAHFFYRRERAATIIMGISAVAGLAFLFLA